MRRLGDCECNLINMRDYISKEITQKSIDIMKKYTEGETVYFSEKGKGFKGKVTKIGEDFHQWNFKDWEYWVEDEY